VFPMRTSLDLAACGAAGACSWVQMATRDRISHSSCLSSPSPCVLVRPLVPLVLVFLATGNGLKRVVLEAGCIPGGLVAHIWEPVLKRLRG